MVFARKRFGQNFLQDAAIIEKIVQALAIDPSATVIEIGPGQGALTKVLLTKVNKLIIIEIDRDLFANLNKTDQIQGICADVLTVNFTDFGDKLYIIGNLPYNISTPILFHLLSYRTAIEDMVFMLQKEVVERILASPGTENYGRLSVIFQYYFDLEYLFTVPAEAFIPQPKVESAVFSMRPKKNVVEIHMENFTAVVKQAFSMRRKTLNNNFKGLLSTKDWNLIGLDASRRAQDLCGDDFVKITNFLSKTNISLT